MWGSSQWLSSMALGLLLGVGWVSLTATANAQSPDLMSGIVLERTRIIYPESAKNGITFTVTNRTAQVYLLQSRVLPWAFETTTGLQDQQRAVASTPFIVLPPLVRFPPEEAITLRIRLTQNTLPQDRESVFSLSLKAIPSQTKSAQENSDTSHPQMVLALQNNLKLFYRPAEMAVMSADERAQALQFTQQGAQLKVKNPTPYYVTLGVVTVNGAPVTLSEQRMIAPWSTAVYDNTAKSGATVRWQLMNDVGQGTPFYTQLLN